MEIAFATKELRDICENKYIAEEKLGCDIAKSLFAVISDIWAVDSIDGLFFREVSIEQEKLKIKVETELEMILVSNHPLSEVDWGSVTRLRLQELRKEHE